MSSADIPPEKKAGPEYTVSDFRLFNAFTDGLIARDSAYTGFRATELWRLRIKTALLTILGILLALLLVVFIYNLITGRTSLSGTQTSRVEYVRVPDPNISQVIERPVIVEVPTYVPIEIPTAEGTVTNFSLFHSVVPRLPGITEVVTGMSFPSSLVSTPDKQWCYAEGVKKIGNSNVDVDIAKIDASGRLIHHSMKGGQAEEAGISQSVFRQLFQHCQFFSGARVDSEDGSASGQPIEDNEEYEWSTGTAFAVNDEGYFVTNAHVVDSCSEIGLIHNDEAYPADLTSRDSVADIAVLKTSSELAKGHIKFSTETKSGQDVIALGFPEIGALGVDLKVTKGIISSMSGFEGNPNSLQFTAPIQAGNSGGPLVNSLNQLVGVTTATLEGVEFQNVNFAVKGAEVQRHLGVHRVPFSLSNTREKLDVPTIVEISSNYVRLVVCQLS